MKKKSAFSILMVILLISSMGIQAAPGDIISLDFELTYLSDEIRSFITPLYSGFPIPEARYTVDVYKMVYESSYPDGRSAQAHAQVFLPRFSPETNEIRGLYVFAPGSTGLLDNCRPSREHEAGIRWGLYRAHVLSHAGQGSIGILPDYLGFNDPEENQYYMVAEAEAFLLLDSVRSFAGIKGALDYKGVRETRNFLGGFSQGGHAVLAAADFRLTYAPEIDLHGVIGFGATPDPVDLMLQYPSVIPMMMYTYSQLYGTGAINPLDIFREDFAEYLEDDVLSQCVGGMQSYYPGNPKYLYKPEFHKALLDNALNERYPSVARVLRMNTTGYGARDVDILLLQGSDDVVIYPETQQEYVHELRSLGISVEYELFPGVRHDTRQVGYALVRRWMDERL